MVLDSRRYHWSPLGRKPQDPSTLPVRFFLATQLGARAPVACFDEQSAVFFSFFQGGLAADPRSLAKSSSSSRRAVDLGDDGFIVSAAFPKQKWSETGNDFFRPFDAWVNTGGGACVQFDYEYMAKRRMTGFGRNLQRPGPNAWGAQPSITSRSHERAPTR